MLLMQNRANKVLQIIAIYTLTIFVYKDFSIPNIAGIALVAFALAVEIYKGKILVTVNKLTSAFFLLALFQILQICRAMVMGNTDQLIYIPVLFLLAACVSFSDSTERSLKSIVKLWTRFSICLAVYVVIVALSPTTYFTIIAPLLSSSSREMNSNLFSKGYGVAIGGNIILIDYFIAFACFFCISSMLSSQKTSAQKKIPQFSLISLFLIAAVLINRKTELFALIISGGYLFFSRSTAASKVQKKRNRRVLLWLIPVLIGIGLVLYMTGSASRYVAFIQGMLLNSRIRHNRDVSSGRFFLWTTAIKLFRTHPLMGIGWGAFSRYVPSNVQVGLINEIHNVHNCYLQVLCETGIVGFLIYYVLMFFIFHKISKQARVVRTNMPNSFLQALSSTCVAYQMFFLITGAIDPTFYSMIFWCIYALTIMMSSAAYKLATAKILYEE